LHIGRGAQFLSNANTVTDLALGGWVFNFILTDQTGLPFTIGCPISTTAFFDPLEYLLRTQAIPPAMAERVADGLLRLHRMYPQNGLILFDYGMALSNRYIDSTSPLPSDFIEQLKEAVRLNPRLPEAYFQLGLVYDERKSYADEVEVLRRAVQLSPLDEQYRYHLAMAYKRLGNKAAFLQEMSTIQQMLSQSGK
jgi:tetratricopeptide (TPR) repeat protein